MKFGVTIFLTDQSISPVELAREAEARDFYSLYFPEHTHIPTNRLTPAPTGEEILAEEYKRTLDPYIAIAAAAQATQKIKLGTGISLILQHHPITLAKCIATLDHLSNSRFVFGTGYGWNKEEMAHHGIKYSNRREAFREWLLGMYQLWGNDTDNNTDTDNNNNTGEFHGEFVNFSSSWSWPKPAKRPKVLIGGSGGEKLFTHIAELADGWIPIGGGGMKEKIPALEVALKKAGRSLAEIDIVPFGVLPNPEKLEYYESLGITEVVFRLESGDSKKVLPLLDELANYLK